MLAKSPPLKPDQEPFHGRKLSANRTFLESIQHHQNNSFDEFRERRYPRANHEDAAL
jgi:hypothetical protein